jgi:cation transport regulator ChaC
MTYAPNTANQKSMDSQTYSIGILAYGSLIDDPGSELSPYIIERIKTSTPFKVEFKRSSATRGGAPTLIPVEQGGIEVNAVILVLDNAIDLNQAKTMLWKRERRSSNANEI